MTRNAKRLLLPVFLLHATAFLLLSRVRLIDGDEGFYLLAARLVLEHKVPYRDFLHLQTPLLPYLYALWMHVAGVSWYSARTLSALLTATLGLAMFVEVSSSTKTRSPALWTALLYLFSIPVLVWFPITKTFATSDLFLFLAFLSINRLDNSRPRLAALLCGLGLGFATDARLYFAALVLLFLVWIARRFQPSCRLSSSLALLAGFLAAIAPNAYFLALAPQNYFFDNLGYHAIRSNAGLIGDPLEKLVILERLAGIGESRGSGVQMQLLLVAGAIAYLTRKRLRPPAALAYQIAAALLVLSLLPTPTLTSYYSVILPFVIIAVVYSSFDLLESLAQQPLAAILVRRFLLALVLLFSFSSIAEVDDFVRTGNGVPGIWWDQNDSFNYRIDTVRSVSEALDRLASPGERVLCFWPGYLLESHAAPLPGMENNFGLYVSGLLTPAQLSQFHVASQASIVAGIAAHSPRLVVVGNQDNLVEADEFSSDYYQSLLERSGYRAVSKIGATSIYQWLP